MKDLSVGSSLNKEFSRDVKWPCQAMKLRHPDLVDISEGLVPFNHLGNLRPFAVENSGKPVPLVCTQIREIVFKPCDFFWNTVDIKKRCCVMLHQKKNSHFFGRPFGNLPFHPEPEKGSRKREANGSRCGPGNITFTATRFKSHCCRSGLDLGTGYKSRRYLASNLSTWLGNISCKNAKISRS